MTHMTWHFSLGCVEGKFITKTRSTSVIVKNIFISSYILCKHRWACVYIITNLHKYAECANTIKWNMSKNKARSIIQISSGHLVLSNLGLAFVLMLKPFVSKFIMITDLLSFVHPSVLLVCFKATPKYFLNSGTSTLYAYNIFSVNFHVLSYKCSTYINCL